MKLLASAGIGLLAAELLTGCMTSRESAERVYAETSARKQAHSPGLIRFYDFENGDLNTFQNRAVSNPCSLAGLRSEPGTLFFCRERGSNKPVERPLEYFRRSVPVRSPGRFQGTTALVLGAPRTGLYRSGVRAEIFRNGITLAGWLRAYPSNVEETTCAILSMGSGVSDGFDLFLNKFRTGYYLSFRLGGKKPELVKADLKTAGVWHFFAVTLDGKTLKLYIDGSEAAEQAFKGSVRAAPDMPRAELAVGENIAWTKTGKTGNVDLDDFAIWGRALTGEEVLELYRAGQPCMTEADQRKFFDALCIDRDDAEKMKFEIKRIQPVPPPPLCERMADALRNCLNGQEAFQAVPVALECRVTLPEKLSCGTPRIVLTAETRDGRIVRRTETDARLGGETQIPLCLRETGVYFINLTAVRKDGVILGGLKEKVRAEVYPAGDSSEKQ